MREIILILIRIVELCIIADALISWVPSLRDNKVAEIIESISAPLVVPIRDILFKIFPRMMIDFSPIIVLFILDFIRMALYR